MKRPPELEDAPPKAVRVKHDWTAIKHDALAGMTVQAIARKWNVPAVTVTGRMVREDWPTPKALAKKAKSIETMQLATGNTYTLEEVEAELSGQIDLTPDGIMRFRSLVLRLCASGLQRFATCAPVPKTWKDVEIMEKMARRAAGLDEKGSQQVSQVNVNVLRMDRDPVIDVSASVGGGGK